MHITHYDVMIRTLCIYKALLVLVLSFICKAAGTRENPEKPVSFWF